MADLRGASRLAIAAVTGITDLVEEMHRNIAGAAPPVGRAPAGRTRGITGLVYGSVRGVTRTVGLGLDTALAALGAVIGRTRSWPQREAVVAALNGVLGDTLAASANPLAITMCLRRAGKALELRREALAAALPDASGRLLVLVHGLCMNDLQWRRDGHDHGAVLARELDATALYLHYNSGLNISENGREFAALLQRLIDQWPVEVRELVIIGHSMGGLVARSACHQAVGARHGWRRLLEAMVFLGTPHHGAALERAGNRFNFMLGISPYTAPFTRLGGIRSAGIRDLRHGNLLDSDWQQPAQGRARNSRTAVPLPARVRCHVVAATLSAPSARDPVRLRGDGLVSVASALGMGEDVARQLGIPASRRSVSFNTGHFDLLASLAVCRTMGAWLAKGNRSTSDGH
ncbi:MAG: esterase/lipase family protein [Burkholderiales bacterium]